MKTGLALLGVLVTLPISAATRPDATNDFRGTPPHMIAQSVWIGDRLFLWSRDAYTSYPLGVSGTYDPADDVWRPVSRVGAPLAYGQPPVWTGSEVILWGGRGPGVAEARYSPAQDSWSPMSSTGAPTDRDGHSAVWAGSEMLVWGGASDAGWESTGGSYDPSSDSWQPISTAGAPSGRGVHEAVWTGSEMIVWGGLNVTGELGDGGRYDPAADVWLPMSASGAPSPRLYPCAHWSGSELLIWGGGLNSGGTTHFGDGARYSPATDSWTPIASAGAPAARATNASVWTGTEMIVWGDSDAQGSLRDGARYDPAADAWTPVAVDADAPEPSPLGDAAWSGSEMIVFGGDLISDMGGLYSPASDSWRPISAGPGGPIAVDGWGFTGSQLVVFGGAYSPPLKEVGGRYDPGLDLWRDVAPSAQAPRRSASCTWSGQELLVWGGLNELNYPLDNGAAYDPVADSWRSMSSAGAPSARYGPVAVWTGTELLLWGGAYDTLTYLDDGARYDPAADSWSPMTSSGRPSGRVSHTAVWTGSTMVVWGGLAAWPTVFGDGAAYDPALDRWSPLPAAGAPSPRGLHAATWSGTEMIVWGGIDISGPQATGGRYDPVTGSWSPTSTAGAPLGRVEHAQVWTGSELFVWGGRFLPGGATYGDGALYDPAADTWRPVASVDAPGSRGSMAAFWTGEHVLIWGGSNTGWYRDGGFYDPATDRWSRGPIHDLLVSPGPGGSAAYGAVVRAYDTTGAATGFDVDAFPGQAGWGARMSGAWIEAGTAGVIAAPGPGPGLPARITGFDRHGVPRAGLDVIAYATPGFGATTGSGPVDGDDAILAGPGPSPVYGPHVRAFRYAQGSVAPIAKVSFYAYGTLRYGVAAAGLELDRDGFAEILTGAGPGQVFGPHVRGFDYDGVQLAPLPGVGFFAYTTLKYGVEIGGADLELDLWDEILTGPGPSSVFGSQLRAFDYDGTAAAAIGRVNAFVFAGAHHGLTVAGGDVDDDGGYGELLAGAGPDPLFGSQVAAFDDDGRGLRPIPALTFDPFGLAYGARVGAARLIY